MIIGITGKSGSGKSEVARLLSEKGFFHIDCDKLVHEAYKTDSVLIKKVDALFSVCQNGEIDRKKLSEKVFSDKQNLEKLNAVVLPRIAEIIKDKIKGKENVILDAPTLIESGLNTLCDKVVFVTADKEKRLSRVMSRDNIEKEKALLRINSQKEDGFYLEKSDYTVFNNGNLSDLLKEVEKLERGLNL